MGEKDRRGRGREKRCAIALTRIEHDKRVSCDASLCIWNQQQERAGPGMQLDTGRLRRW